MISNNVQQKNNHEIERVDHVLMCICKNKINI